MSRRFGDADEVLEPLLPCLTLYSGEDKHHRPAPLRLALQSGESEQATAAGPCAER